MSRDIERLTEINRLEKELTARQLTFCNEYLKLGNGAQAAINAGYSERSAKEIASENLTKPNIKRYVELKQEQIQDETIADAIEIQQYLTSVIRGEEVEEVYRSVGGGAEVKDLKKPSLADRTRAAELMGRRYALFTDRTEIDGNVGAVIIDDIPSDSE